MQHKDCGVEVARLRAHVETMQAGANKRKATQITADADSATTLLVPVPSLGETIEGNQWGMGRGALLHATQ
eukprot:5258473-Amphidinium_carterae.1